jgi:hypothetical protein
MILKARKSKSMGLALVTALCCITTWQKSKGTHAKQKEVGKRRLNLQQDPLLPSLTYSDGNDINYLFFFFFGRTGI